MEENKDVGFLDSEAGKGYEKLSTNDYALPFLKILQPLSPEVIDPSAQIEGAKPGDIINTLTRKNYGSSVEVIPVYYDNLWLEWEPNRGGLKGRHQPFSIPVTGDTFGAMKAMNGNDIVENQLFYVMIIGELELGPVLLPLSKTGLKHGKRWNSNIRMTRLPNGKQAPYYSSVWRLETKLNKNDLGVWYTLGDRQTTHIERTRYITKEEYTEFVLPSRKLMELSASKVNLAAISAPAETEY